MDHPVVSISNLIKTYNCFGTVKNKNFRSFKKVSTKKMHKNEMVWLKRQKELVVRRNLMQRR